jgi:hypothetical protein
LLGPLVVGVQRRLEMHDADHLWRRPAVRVAAAEKTHQQEPDEAGEEAAHQRQQVVYSYETGLKELERAVLALLATCTDEVGGLEDFINHTAQHVLDDLRQYPWYQPFDGERFPLEQDFLPIRLFANALKSEMDSAGDALLLSRRARRDRAPAERSDQLNAQQGLRAILHLCHSPRSPAQKIRRQGPGDFL